MMLVQRNATFLSTVLLILGLAVQPAIAQDNDDTNKRMIQLQSLMDEMTEEMNAIEDEGDPEKRNSLQSEVKVVTLFRAMEKNKHSFYSTDTESERRRLVSEHRSLLLEVVALMQQTGAGSPSRLFLEPPQDQSVNPDVTYLAEEDARPWLPGEKEHVQRRLVLMRMTLESVLDHISMRSYR